MVAAFGASWTVGRTRCLLPCLADTVTRPDHEGGPVFGLLLEELRARLARDRIAWLLDFGDQPASPAMLMRGWRAVGPWGIASHRPPGAAEVGGTLPEGFRTSGEHSQTLIEGTRSLTADLWPSIERLTVEQGRSDRVSHARDVEYLSWRARNPLATYLYVTARRDAAPTAGGPVEGFLVVHRSRIDPDARGRPTPTSIVDVEATSDVVFRDLLEVTLRRLPAADVHVWTRDLAQRRQDLLLELGFNIDLPTGSLTADRHLPTLLICSTGVPPPAGFDELQRPGRWDVRGVCGRSWR